MGLPSGEEIAWKVAGNLSAEWEQLGVFLSAEGGEVLTCTASWDGNSHCEELRTHWKLHKFAGTAQVTVLADEAASAGIGEIVGLKAAAGCGGRGVFFTELERRECAANCVHCVGPDPSSCVSRRLSEASVIPHSPDRSLIAIDHYAVFQYTEPFTSSLQRYTFENTHKLTVSIEAVAKFSNGAITKVEVETPTGTTLSAAGGVTLAPAVLTDLTGSYTVNVRYNSGSKTSSNTVTVTIKIACASAPSDCYCAAGSYPNTKLTMCATCPSSSAQCPFMRQLGCLISSLNSSPPTTFVCSPCGSASSYLDTATGLCAACAANCAMCLGPAATDCIACITYAQALTTPGECKCNSGFYLNAPARTCGACSSLCLECSDGTATGCTACKANASLSGPSPSSCVCNSGYGGSAASCALCSTSCLTCTTTAATTCLSCKVAAQLSGTAPNSCVCIAGYFPNTTSGNCAVCDATCLTCAGSGALKCTSCKSFASLVSTAPCACACVYGYVGSPDNCTVCDSTCRTCSQPGISGCASCMYNAHLTLSVAPSPCDCNPRFYPSPTVQNCRSCYSTCGSCLTYGSSKCLTCADVNAQLAGTAPSACTCKAGYYSSSGCQPCNLSCSTCLSSSSQFRCTSCKANASLRTTYYFRNYGYCACVTGFYPDTTAANCVACHASCRKCSGPNSTSCQGCKSYATLSSGTCTCIKGYIMDAAFNCVVCDPSCLECSGSPSPCTACGLGYSLLLAVCVCDFPPCSCSTTCSTCSGAGAGYCLTCLSNAELAGFSPAPCVCRVGYYPNPDSANCAACDGHCASCLGPSASECASCSLHAYLDAGEAPGSCVCEDQYYNSSTTSTQCTLCHATCKSCSAGGSSSCLSCFDNALLSGLPGFSSCVCATGYYPNTDSSNCELCDPTCKTCDTETNCKSCYSNATVASGQCVCLDGYFPNPTSATCAACNLNCKNCIGANIDDCTECFTGAQLEYLVSPGKCACIITAFTTTDAAHCQLCHTSCKQCSGTGASKCTSCFQYATLAAGVCSCNPGYLPLPDLAHCGTCHSTCLTCTGQSSTECQSCYSNAIVSSGSCVCATGYFPSPSSAACQSCFNVCKTCSGSGEFECATCYLGAVVSPAGTCECDVGFFTTTDAKSCNGCHATCKHCSSPSVTACTECFSNAEFAGGLAPDKCQCASGFFSDPTAKTCTACDISCASCSAANATSCQSCYAGAQLQGTAPSACACLSSHYLATTLECEPCHTSCLTCAGPLNTDCKSCAGGATLATVPGICDCPVGQFLDAVVCKPCATVCSRCSGATTSQCTSCYANADIENSETTGKCICKGSFYPNPDASKCAPCHSTCLECVEGGSTQCTACRDLGKLNSGACECAEDSYPAPDVNHCKLCSALCLGCVGDGEKMCKSCRANAILRSALPSECICSVGYFPSPDASQCMRCPPGCATCASSSECLACGTNTVTKDGKCVCADRFFPQPDASNCVQCAAHCSVCGELGCRQCEAGLLVASGECVDQCPPGYTQQKASSLCEALDLSPPVPALSVLPDNSLSVSFDKPMNCSFSASDISIAVKDSSSRQVEVTWSDPLPVDLQSWTIALQLESKSVREALTAFLSFLRPEKVTGLNGLSTSLDSLSAALYTVSEPQQNSSTTAPLLKTSAATTAAATSRGGVSASVATSLVNGNPGSLISLVNQLQLITYLSMSKLPLPTNFASTLAALNVGGMLPNPASGMFSFSVSDSSQTPPKHVSDYGIDTTLFFVNAMTFISMSICVLAAFVPIYLLSRVNVQFIAKYFSAMLPSLRWSVPLNLWLTSYLDMSVFALLQVVNARQSVSNALTGTSLVVAAAAVLLVAVTPVAVTAFIAKNADYIRSDLDKEFNARWGVLFLGFRPYSSRLDQVESLTIEASTLVIYSLASSFVLDLSSSMREQLDAVGTWAVRAAIFLNVLMSLVRTVCNVAALLSLYKARMKLVKAKYALHGNQLRGEEDLNETRSGLRTQE